MIEVGYHLIFKGLYIKNVDAFYGKKSLCDAEIFLGFKYLFSWDTLKTRKVSLEVKLFADWMGP
ncbi:hypothetical protein GCM10023092_06360 [Rurimicrobium arvi]|uniref:Uncharacterized protein n=1 Tax=Rurimicrobium arvi TaxID=2049916 RepID=A0ABP8MJG6_9BACT